MRVLVTGGAGYVGAHICKQLARGGHEVVVLDSFVTGHRAAARWGTVVEGSLLDDDVLRRAFSGPRIDAVVHCAGSISVAESVREPLAYYRNNVAGALQLLRAARHHGVAHLVFSSTAAVYGEPRTPVVDEQHPTAPLNPYGHSKLMVEQLLRDECAAGGFGAVALRYFNAAGADPDGELGEAHAPETHLIPLLLKSALGGPPVQLYGDDYDTPDGTCVRDYVHVTDLAQAHLLALGFLQRHGGFHAFNLGNGRGHSVRQVVAMAQRVVGGPLRVESAPRRPGDAAVLVASGERARRELGWSPLRGELETIIGTAWRWHRQPRY